MTATELRPPASASSGLDWPDPTPPPEVTLTWGPRARVFALAMTLAFAAIAAWAGVDPKTSRAVVVFAAAMALVGAGVTVEAFIMRAWVDARGLSRRSLRGRRSTTWAEVRLALLVSSSQAGTTITHARTLEPALATHLLLPTVAGAGPRWAFNAWMSGFPELVELVAHRGLIASHDPEQPPPSAAEAALTRAAERLDRANAAGMQIVMGFALLFFLFVTSVVLVAGQGIEITGEFFVDLVLVAVALGLTLRLISTAAWLLGGLRYAGSADRQDRRTSWLMNATGLLAGLLFASWFVPPALAGEGDKLWVTWILAALGIFMIYGALRDWVRGE